MPDQVLRTQTPEADGKSVLAPWGWTLNRKVARIGKALFVASCVGFGYAVPPNGETTLPANVAPPDGNKLLQACAAAIRQVDGAALSEVESASALWCIGYVSGFLDGLAVLRWKGGSTPVCLPAEGVDNEQAIRIVVAHLRAHPTELHLSARPAVVNAIGNAFRCPEDGTDRN